MYLYWFHYPLKFLLKFVPNLLFLFSVHVFICGINFGQVASALQFIHKKGIAHLDVKPENIYVKNGVYKLGDFGCATLLDNSLPIEEGDAHYMPQEILNENYDHLDKVDIFSLGASIYELIRRLPLPESGCQFFNLKEGKFPLLPGHSLQLQNLLKVLYSLFPMFLLSFNMVDVLQE